MLIGYQVVRLIHYGLAPDLAWLISHFLMLKRAEMKRGISSFGLNYMAGRKPTSFPELIS